MFNKLFTGNKGNRMIEPIFPGEGFTVFSANLEEGLSIATINVAYDNYPNKGHFPWCAQILLSIFDTNENGHPTNEEAAVLNDIEDKITEFLKRTQTVHPIGRVTRNAERDIIYYIDNPKFNQEETKVFF